ncbi:MAG: FadR family transcriptional regulator [Caldilineaceae bacterium]|nr:FadR family transcriptional regulator [Caldilineaceae bacterium]
MGDGDLFRPVSRKDRLVDRLVVEIQEFIIKGHLEPGMMLPPERELAETLGVSRTVVREAVHILVAKGLLSSQQGVGTIVREVTRDQVVEPLGWLLRSRGATFDHLHQVRSVIEVEIAGLAATSATSEDIANLSRNVEEMAGYRADAVRFAACDASFHQILASSVHNPLMPVLLDSFRDLMADIRLEINRQEGVFDTVLVDHNQIVDAIRQRDPTAARAAMQTHLDHARAFQNDYLKRGSGSGTVQPLIAP